MIPLIQSTFYNEKETKKNLTTFIERTKKLSFGNECERFEKKFARWQGREYTTFVNSGSAANLAIIQALLNLGKIKKGDQVGFSALTWSTNVMPLIQLGLTAIPIDVDLRTLNVASGQLEETLKKENIQLLFLTNLLGFCADIDRISYICKEKNILLIEDNCEALGSVYKGKKLGNFGLASTFSFYVGHHMSTIEGGAICTDDRKLAEMLQLVRAHGWDRNLNFDSQNAIRKKYNINSTFYSRYTFYDLGFNMRPTEIAGFLGSNQLRFLNTIIKKREKNFLEFTQKLYSLEDRFYPIAYDHMDIVSNFAVPVICKSRTLRDTLIKKCKNTLEIRPIVAGDITKQPFFRKYMSRQSNISCPNAELVNNQGFYFGNNPQLSEKEKKTIFKTLLS